MSFILRRSLSRRAESLPLSDAQRKTIYALSTPPGKAGVGVVRISGPDAVNVWTNMVKSFRKSGPNFPEPWKMQRCKIVHPTQKTMLDSGLAVFFPGPKSFTTEDVLELHVHSGRAVVASVLAALSCFPHCRPAEAGEFTRRAFQGGRLDLTEVEGLKDLIDAETETQQRHALRAAGGVVRAQFEELRTETIHCLALVEALIDFGEGEDIEDGVFEQARSRALNLRDKIQSYLQDRRRGEIIRSGIKLAIFGPPNAGKSSLLNFLAQRDAAIVTPIPGTTRDILELSLDLGGVPIIVADTAGIRETDDMVESIGIERAQKTIRASDVSLCVLSLPEITSGGKIRIPQALQSLATKDTFFLLNKSDITLPGVDLNEISRVLDRPLWICSLTTGQGTKEFLEQFSSALQTRFDLHESNSHHIPLITRARHRTHLENACQFLEAFISTGPEDVVLGAEELRYAAQAIGKVSGLIDTEDVLDAVFREFCIGK
ncbi:tRNA modification GTPase TrmE [Mycena floridula]|nr:tRNA modification GTPase TrmE [Mycena floridula]